MPEQTRSTITDEDADSCNEIRIFEEWRVIDRWWTDAPILRRFRIVETDGQQHTEFRENDETEWRVWNEGGVAL